MNSILNLLSLRRIEYLLITQGLEIVLMSPGVSRLAEVSEKVKPGQDVRLSFPELVGSEEILEAIHQGEQDNFEFKGIIRWREATSPLYVDIWITKNAQVADSGDLIVLVEDVTERMVLEQSLVQGANEANLLLRTLTASKQYIDQIVTSMAEALLVTTLSGKIKTINQAALAMFGYSEFELLGQPITSVIYSNNSSPITSVSEVETVCHTKQGTTVPVSFSCSLVQTDMENFRGYVYILRDMTERKQAELAKQEFLAMISHEVRTPITSVMGMASLLLNTQLSTDQQDFVETIHLSGDALLRIINDFLDFSKIEAGRLELEDQPFVLKSCIQQAIDLMMPTAREKGLRLKFVDARDLKKTVLGDITRLRQILVNLLSNALKFTETGGVEISAIAHSIDNSDQSEIQFAVKDTGIGIPEDRLDRLFKAFSQVNSSITRQYGGTGLGLAICKKLSELMGGKIWVESESFAGSTFYFTIKVPIVADKVEEVVEDDFLTAEEHPLKILLVEDHLINQKMIQILLDGMGYKADVSNNGLEALSALRRQSYDVVLMDVQMPKMDGLTATQHICEEWKKEVRPRIIALTASAMWGDRERCLAAGMDDYLTKPIPIKELIQVLKKCQPVGSGGVGE
nr:response regulator [Nostocaceae cyanobacterium]